MPAGSCNGRNARRPTLSATSTSSAPSTALPVSNAVCPPRSRARAMCGAISPTKPMLPTQETQAAVSSTGASTRSSASREVDTPNPVAAGLPSSATSAARAVNISSAKAGIAQPAAIATSVQFAACRLPASHSIAVCTSRTSAVVIKTPIAAANAQETPMPIRIKHGREISRASTTTSSAVSSPPAMPITGRQNRLTAGNWKISSSTAALQPSFTPISPGSASPLRVMDCIAAPAMPSIAPHSSAISRRGRRISSTM